MRWHEIDWHRFDVYFNWSWIPTTLNLNGEDWFSPKDKDGRIMNSSQRTNLSLWIWMVSFPSYPGSFLQECMPNARNWNFAMRNWGSKNGAENLWTSYLKAPLTGNGINNLGLGLGVNKYGCIETMEIWKWRTSRTDFQQVLDCL